MAKYYLGYFSNGYCGCDETHGFISDNIERVREFCEDLLPEYAEEAVDGCLTEEEQQDEDTMENYRCDCSFEVQEVSKEVMENEMMEEDPIII